MPLFRPRLIGLTGSPKEIRRATLAYKVYYTKYPPGSPDYVINHSSFIYLVDKSGTYIGFFPPGTIADRMVGIIKLHLPERPKK
jgi:protein SCO1/2